MNEKVWARLERWGLGGFAMGGLLWMMHGQQEIERERTQFMRLYMEQQTKHMSNQTRALENIERVYTNGN